MKLYLLLLCLLLGSCSTNGQKPDMYIIPTAPGNTQTAPEPTQTIHLNLPTQTAPEYAYAKPITDGSKETLNAATIKVLKVRPHGIEAKPIDEQRIGTCIKNKILEHNSRQNIISFDKVASKLFPNVPKDRVLRSPEDLSILLNDERFYSDISTISIRYVIFVGGDITKVGNSFSGGGAGPGFAGGFWLKTWDNETRLSASILDIRLRNDTPKKAENTSTDTSWFLLLVAPLPIPIGWPSFAVHNACSNIGDDVGKILLERATQ